MTLLIMPSDYGIEMLVGSSPLMGTGFLGSSSYLTEYSRCSGVWRDPPSTSCLASLNSGSSVPSLGIESAFSNFGINGTLQLGEEPARRSCGRSSIRRRKLGIVDAPPLHCLKSCLVSRTEEQIADGATSPTKEKKKVSFADASGGNLTYVKIITEKPDCPPRWSQDFLDQVTGGAKAEAVPDQWALAFSQPASDYMSWKAKLEKDNIAVENVVIKEDVALLIGTVKVRNISFHKEVTVRYTTDSWCSHRDVLATYVPTPSSGCSYNLYDTFSFEIPLPCSFQSEKLEFCLSYTTDGYQFWDNNSDKNYVVLSFRSQKPCNNKGKPQDLYDLHLNSWSEFSAWNHLEDNDSPYW